MKINKSHQYKKEGWGIFFNTESKVNEVQKIDEIGILKLKLEPRKELKAGDVGYIISGIKSSKEVKVGDTIMSKSIIVKIARRKVILKDVSSSEFTYIDIKKEDKDENR